MRRIALITLAAAGLTLGACSKDTAEDLQNNVQQAGAEIKEGAAEVVNDPDVREAGAAVKEAAKDGGAALKEVAQEAGTAAKDAVDKNDAEVPAEDKRADN